MKSRQLKIMLLLAMIITLSFHHNFKALYKGIQRYNRQELDQITTYEMRFSDLKEYLPNHAVVGYISDYDEKSGKYGQAYSMTQYVIAPVILVRGIKRKFIIGNFLGAQPNIKKYERKNIALVRDFGNGAVLFKKRDR
jgi:hypothetical protein